MRNTVLKEMDKCSGCGLCETVCPAQAIKMEYDKSGFIYPVIQKEKCIDCGLCERKCVVKTVSVEYPRTCYAGVHLDEKIRAKSSSGGMFAALAEYTLEQGGVVFGAAVVPKGKIVTVKHIMIKNKEELKKLQGSKYVQSDIRECYTNVKQQLAEGKKVLFSGTPCQVAAMKNYLGKEYDDLLLVDLVCHGTPSILHWEKSIEEKLQNDEKVSAVSFRGKEGYMQGEIEFKTEADRIRKENYSFRNDSYYSMFLNADSYREGCYQCQYARPERDGDITIGDFWGFEKAYDRAQIEKDAKISLEEGNSLIAVNTEKGLSICNKLNGEKMWLYAADYEEAVKYNPQLSQPSKKGKNRALFLTLYKIGGWKLVSTYGNIKMKLRKIIEHTP
ncbi:Coenzyme F420 hydrogenase/dehydrogenase, beta subunit C-terminal domain [[Ruminococcus] torques]|uniref:Coenzyme F420-reducing hydrogenase subunit beta n=2 Tax=Mediterraneibacter TaxID=2316020 RepID=A0A174ZF06_9FIRM|nr:Coenzyme F420 hydrogenase/dehydrogenase, beta subunit C-terminal domain [[Ruminococcus] torques]CUQ82776.1 coenzyme F420-reducing hydrogenase subunit beta [[Ruminococcus] torques]